MLASSVPLMVGVSIFLAQAPAQGTKAPARPAEEQYRDYFKKPENAAEWWAAINYEINVGRFNLAARDLKDFLATKPTDQDLLEIEEREGMSSFLRLLRIPELRPLAGPLVERVSAIVKKQLGDPVRLRRLVAQLAATPEERAYAVAELRRSGALAGPFLVAALLKPRDNPEHRAVVTTLSELGREVAAPLAAALDSGEPSLQIELIEAFDARHDVAVVPYLWYWSAAPRAVELVRSRAAETIAHLLGIGVEKLPPAREALVREAERYERHQVRFADPQAVAVWVWDGNGVTAQLMSPAQAEEYYGLYFARRAIELDPRYIPAQVVFLSIALQKGAERAGAQRRPEASAQDPRELLKQVSPGLVNAVLERALVERRPAVAAAAARALGDVGDVRALRPTSQKEPALVQALYYPDAAVQLAAADAVLRIPAPNRGAYGPRIVEILRRALAADAPPHVLVADLNLNRAHELSHALQQAGYQAEAFGTGRELLRRLAQAADVDAVFIDANVPDPPLPHLLAQIRADVNSGLVPVFVSILPGSGGKVSDDVVARLNRLAEPYPNVRVTPSTVDVPSLRDLLAEHSATALSPEQRKANAGLALVWLARLAQGEPPAYDVRAAEPAILRALEIDDLAPVAIAAAAKLPGTRPQQELATILFRSPRPELRAAAAAALARHVQQFGLALSAEQVRGVGELYDLTGDPKLKSSLGLLVGSLRPDPRATAERLGRFNPAAKTPAPPQPAPPPPEEPKEPEKDKEPDKDK